MRDSIVMLLAAATVSGCAGAPVPSPAPWMPLFNGRDLSGWTPKIAGHDLGQNFANTFRVADRMIQVRYDGYSDFDSQFGHLFYRAPFSSYHLVVEYRFVGEWHRGTPDWARRNSGVMLHAQDPATMLKAQDFPISIEAQFLAGLDDGRPRTTANMCSPGTEVDIEGAQARGHCVNSRSMTYPLDEWVRFEAIVRGDSIRHVVNGDTVMVYTRPRIGGGNVSGHDPAMKTNGTPLTRGWIALQSEGHPIDFRRVEIRDLARPR
ncbi:MAG TPA: DUF1080 domain-containing protein [Gemmatimonadaceae bacterium]|nr:DUF1080 domain-containing protein [Gemmatimonadaceae bacterium]